MKVVKHANITYNFSKLSFIIQYY